MSDLINHPVFDQLARRFQAGDYTTKVSSGDWITSITFKFKSGFCRGVKVTFESLFDDKSFRKFDCRVYSGFFAQTRWLAAEDIPEPLYLMLHDKAKEMLQLRLDRSKDERDAFRIEALDNCL